MECQFGHAATEWQCWSCRALADASDAGQLEAKDARGTLAYERAYDAARAKGCGHREAQEAGNRAYRMTK